MSRRSVISALIVFLVLAMRARADFHDWRITEVFSDASGKVQFIELQDVLENGEEFVSGHPLATNSGSITFPSDLPSDQTLNKSFLVATADFASLPGAPTPDYTIPANFINTAGDNINYAGVDSFSFGAGELPTDGVSSVSRDLNAAMNSPTNFAGQTGSIRVGAPPTGIPLPPALLPGALLAAMCVATRKCAALPYRC